MKNKCIAVALYMFIASSLIFSQETKQASGELYIPQVLLHTPSFFSKTSYQWKDGTPVKYKDVLANVGAVPGNELLLRQEKVWRVLAYMTAGLFLTSVVTASVYANGDFPRSDVMFPAGLSTGLVSFLAFNMTWQAARVNLQSAVDRYNLYVIGILVSPK
jgi:hypothetical protein